MTRKILSEKITFIVNDISNHRRSIGVAAAVVLMVGVYVFGFALGERSVERAGLVTDASYVSGGPGQIVDVVIPDDAGRVQRLKSARVRGAYVYPLHAELMPYDPVAEDELKVDMPNADESRLEEKAVAPKKHYRYALQNTASKSARIAIIIDDVGMNRKQSRAVVEMDSVPLTLAFLPYAPNLSQLTVPAQEAGHELMIHMPMEPMNSKVPLGSIAIKDGMSADEIEAMLEQAYASFDGFTGLNNHMGSRATQNKAAMDVVMRSLDARGLFYVDSKTISTSVAADAARERGIAHAERDIFLDHEESLEFARGALARLERVAIEKGHAIAIGHPKVNTIAALREWIPTLEARGFEIVPVSEVLLHPSGGAPAEKLAVVKGPAPAKKKKIVRQSAPKFILNEPDVSEIMPAAGNVEISPRVEPSVAVEDLLSAPITGGLYELSE